MTPTMRQFAPWMMWGCLVGSGLGGRPHGLLAAAVIVAAILIHDGLAVPNGGVAQ